MIEEDEITRTRKHREEFESRVNQLKELGAPQIIIDEEIMISQMTHKGYENYKAQRKKEAKEERKNWIKNNPMRKEVVENIFTWFDNTELSESDKDGLLCGCGMCLGIIMDPCGYHIGMTKEEFEYDLYRDLIKGLAEEKGPTIDL